MEHNYEMMISEQGEAMKTDIKKMVNGAVEMSKLLRRNRYDENLLQNNLQYEF